MTTETAAGLPAQTIPPAPVETASAEGVPADGSSWRSRRRQWETPALITLLAATAILYLWSLSSSGWANAYYSAAAQAGGASWKAWFFGSFDASSSVTVDKPPASMWVMGLSVRIFGLSSLSILVPQALMGVASVGALFASVKRLYGPVAGLIAGAALALTPIATLMFRFNNPDALLVLLMILAAWATLRAVESGSTWWLVSAGAFVGFAFLTKMLQAFLVLPAFGLAYLIAGPPKLLKRLGQLALAGVSLVVSAGWWVAIVELMPASSRPYIGGSQGNSILELTLGYNGLGRITGTEVGKVGAQNGPRAGSGTLTRMFDGVIGGQISWLLPAALALLVIGLVVTFRSPRTDLRRAGYIVWGGWLVVTAVIFSYMEGIFHEYYTVALAPAIAALIGMGTAELWPRRKSWPFAALLATLTALTAWWAWTLLGRSGDWQAWLRPTVLIGGLFAAVALLGAPRLPALGITAAGGIALAAAFAGPAAYAVQTAATPHNGAIVTAGPSVQGTTGGMRPGGAQNGAARDGTGLTCAPGGTGTAPGGTGTTPGGTGTAPGAGTGTVPGQAGAGRGQNGGQQCAPGAQGGQMPGGTAQGGQLPGAQGGMAPGGQMGGQTGGNRGGGIGGLLNAQSPGAEITNLLKADADKYTWVAAAVGANNAAGYQLATQLPVMAIGGFNGSDPAPTLEQFKTYVAQGKVHYFLGGSGPQANSGSKASQEIATWVTQNFTAKTVGGVTVYDLTTGAAK